MLQLRQLLAELYQQTGDTDRAIAQYEAIAQLAPNDVGVQETLYDLYIQKQDLNRAAETLQQMMTLDPANFAHPYRLAQLLEQVGQTANALTYAEQALDLAPPDQRTLITDLVAALQGSN
ncbi:MAG: tetratricopeptide repeat protein [Caldilineaceae bacterium]